jgi:hypothetical protein
MNEEGTIDAIAMKQLLEEEGIDIATANENSAHLFLTSLLDKVVNDDETLKKTVCIEYTVKARCTCQSNSISTYCFNYYDLSIPFKPVRLSIQVLESLEELWGNSFQDRNQFRKCIVNCSEDATSHKLMQSILSAPSILFVRTNVEKYNNITNKKVHLTIDPHVPESLFLLCNNQNIQYDLQAIIFYKHGVKQKVDHYNFMCIIKHNEVWIQIVDSKVTNIESSKTVRK